jgi:hypothetical protein
VKHTWSLLVLLALRASLLLAGGYFIVGFGKRCRGGGLRQLPLLVREVERRNEVLVTRDVRDGLVGVVTGRIPFPLNLIQLKSIAGGTTDNGIYLINFVRCRLCFDCWVCDMPWRSYVLGTKNRSVLCILPQPILALQACAFLSLGSHLDVLERIGLKFGNT